MPSPYALMLSANEFISSLCRAWREHNNNKHKPEDALKRAKRFLAYAPLTATSKLTLRLV